MYGLAPSESLAEKITLAEIGGAFLVCKRLIPQRDECRITPPPLDGYSTRGI